MMLGEYNFIITVADNDRQNAEKQSTVVAACVKVMGLPPWQREQIIDEKLHRPRYIYIYTIIIIIQTDIFTGCPVEK